MSDYKEYLSGKSVALVGPAATLRGTEMGTYIDSHDIVVRLNHAWPLSEELMPDTGSRTDIIYHNLNPKNQRIRRKDVLRMHKEGIRWLVSSQPPDRLRFRRRQRRFRGVNKGLLKFRVIPATLKSRLRRRVGYPNSGLVAIVDLLGFPIDRLFVTGFSFYTTGYLGYRNYRGISRKMAVRIHNQRRHKSYMARLVDREERLEVDSFIAQLLQEHVQAKSRGKS